MKISIIVKMMRRYFDIFIDPYEKGAVLSIEQCQERMHKALGQELPFERELLEPAPKLRTVMRMLNNLRNETRQNRELNNEIILRELNDKKERLQRIEMILQEPMMTQSELERLTTDVKNLQRHCAGLEDKIRQNAPADDKLAIYRS